MTLTYTPAIKKTALHIITINEETLKTTRVKEVVSFASTRIYSKRHWKELKEAIRLGNKLEINTQSFT